MLDTIDSVSDELKALLAAFNLDRFGVGRHIVRDERGWRVRDIQVESMWLATIAPSFDKLSYLMVVHADQLPQAILCFKGADSLPDINEEPIAFPRIDDGVANSLKNLDLFARDGYLSLDGIGYSLRVRTWALSADLEFSNPKIESLRVVVRELYEVAASVASVSERRELNDYLAVWHRYIT